MRKVRLYLVAAAAVFVLAALVHGGVLLSGYEHRQARIAETVIAAMLIGGFAAGVLRPAWARGAAIIATSLALVGMLMGITAILAGVGPRTPLDLVAHAVMVAVLVAGLLAAVRYRGPATYGGDPGRLEARRRAG